jgi:hypothetical protein
MDLNLKSGHLVFNGFIHIFEKSGVGFVGMWENPRFFQVIVESVGKSFVIPRMETLFPIGRAMDRS